MDNSEMVTADARITLLLQYTAGTIGLAEYKARLEQLQEQEEAVLRKLDMLAE